LKFVDFNPKDNANMTIPELVKKRDKILMSEIKEKALN